MVRETVCVWLKERAAIVMCLAVRGGQGWSDSLSSDFHLLIGRRGGERSVGPCNLLLVLSLFVFCSSQTSVFFSPLLSAPSLSLQPQELADWQLHCSIPPQVYAYSDVLNTAFILSFLFNLAGWSWNPGRKGSQEALIITSCLRHLLQAVLCLLLPHCINTSAFD